MAYYQQQLLQIECFVLIFLYSNIIIKLNTGINKNSMNVFKFPKSLKQFNESFGLHDLKRRISLHQDNYTDLRLKNIYQVKQACIDRNYVLYAKCKFCKAFIKYTKQIDDLSDRYILYKHNNVHEHIIQKTQVTQQMVDYLRMAFGKVPQDLLKTYFMQKFDKKGINQRQYEAAFQIARKDYEKKAFIQELEEYGRKNYMSMVKKSHIQMNLDETNMNKQHFPIFLFLSTPQMKAQYDRFGKIIYIHRFPYLIPKDTINSQDWMVLVISGIDNFHSIIFYGFSICYGLSSASVALTLKSFFEHFSIQKCQTIITQNQDELNKGYNQFFQYQSKRTQGRVKISQLWDLMLDIKQPHQDRKKVLKRLITTCSQKDFDATVWQYRRKMKSTDATKFQIFLKKSPKYCLLRIPNTFIGIRIGMDHFQEIFNSITKNFPREEEYNIFVFRFTNYLNETKLIRGRTNLLTKILITPLADCYPVVSQYAMNYLYETLIDANMVNFYPNQGRNKVRIGNHQVQIIRTYETKIYHKQIVEIDKEIDRENQNDEDESKSVMTPFSGFQSIKSEKTIQKKQGKLIFECDCNMKKKTGLPCAHIMRICLYYGIPISSQIDDFWDARKQLSVQKEGYRQIIYHKMAIGALQTVMN